MPRQNLEAWWTDASTVTAAGTAVQLTSHTVAEGFSLVVRAKPGNAGSVYYGETQTVAEAQTHKLDPGEAIVLNVSNSNLVWVDADNNGDGVDYFSEGSG